MILCAVSSSAYLKQKEVSEIMSSTVLVMAPFCHRMASYSHVLDVVNVGLDFCNNAINLLLEYNGKRVQMLKDMVDIKYQ